MADERDAEESLPGTGLVVGIVLGAAVGAVAALLVDQSLALAAGYGAGGGLVVGGLTGQLADANRGQDEWVTRVVGGGAALGLLVGVALGALVAWVQSDTVAGGMVVGGPAGLVHGLLVGVVLVANDRAKAASE